MRTKMMSCYCKQLSGVSLMAQSGSTPDKDVGVGRCYEKTEVRMSESINNTNDKQGVDDDVEKIFDVFGTHRRRNVIKYLRQHWAGAPLSVKHMSTVIAAWELDIEPEMVSHNQRKAVYVSLIQSHLGKMDSVGFVSYDEERKWVAPDDLFFAVIEEFESLREAVNDATEMDFGDEE